MKALLLAALLAAPASSKEVCYKITSKMWDARAGMSAPTSPEILQRLHEAFKVWETASAGALKLKYKGLSGISYDNEGQIPEDGCVHAVLYGEKNFHGELAHGGYRGEIPDGYKRGHFFASREPAALNADTLVHEIGHTLGLHHAAVNTSIMFSGPRARAGAALSEQDRADIRLKWGDSGVYSISGTIESKREYPMASVFAVAVKDGFSYSARSDHTGRFSVALLEPGEYKLVAKAIGYSRDLNPAALGGMSDSWYVAGGVSARGQSDAAVLSLTKGEPHLAGLTLKTLDEPAAAKPASESRVFSKPSVARPDAMRPPVVRLTFDRGMQDEGRFKLKPKPSGDELRIGEGLRGGGLFVGGSDDWLDFELPPALSLDGGFTLELWFRRDGWTNPYRGGSGWQTLVSLTTDASISLTAPGCPLHKPWAVHGSVSSGQGLANVLSAPDQPAGKWTHAAMVYEPAEKKIALYLDGKKVDEAKGADPEFKYRNMRLGTWHKSNQAFRGEIDEVDVYDYVRQPEEIAAAAGSGS